MHSQPQFRLQYLPRSHQLFQQDNLFRIQHLSLRCNQLLILHLNRSQILLLFHLLNQVVLQLESLPLLHPPHRQLNLLQNLLLVLPHLHHFNLLRCLHANPLHNLRECHLQPLLKHLLQCQVPFLHDSQRVNHRLFQLANQVLFPHQILRHNQMASQLHSHLVSQLNHQILQVVSHQRHHRINRRNSHPVNLLHCQRNLLLLQHLNHLRHLLLSQVHNPLTFLQANRQEFHRAFQLHSRLATLLLSQHRYPPKFQVDNQPCSHHLNQVLNQQLCQALFLLILQPRNPPLNLPVIPLVNQLCNHHHNQLEHPPCSPHFVQQL